MIIALFMCGCGVPEQSTLTVHNQTRIPIVVELEISEGTHTQSEKVSLTPGDSLNLTLLYGKTNKMKVSVNGKPVGAYEGPAVPAELREEAAYGADGNLYVHPKGVLFDGPTPYQKVQRQNWPMLLTPFCCGIPLIALWVFYLRKQVTASRRRR